MLNPTPPPDPPPANPRSKRIPMAEDLEVFDGEEGNCGELHATHGHDGVIYGEENGGGLTAAGVLQGVHSMEEMPLQAPVAHPVQYPTPHALQEPVARGFRPLEPHAEVEFVGPPASSAEDKQAKGRDSPSQQDEYPGPNFPEDIWCHIHSLMPMRDAAQVACVSQAFARFWRCHPNLVFTDETLGLMRKSCYEGGKMRHFASKVDHILKNHSGIGVKILKLVVNFGYNMDCCYIDHLDSWLHIAVKPGIEQLTLSLPSLNASLPSLNASLSSLNARYNFPCSLLSSGTRDSLCYLSLAGCNFHPTVKCGCLRSLTRLDLCMVHIEDQELGCFLANSFALERLEIRYCSGTICLKIPFLKRLSFLTVTHCERLQAIESKASNLSSFDFAGDLRVQLSLGDTRQIRKLRRICNNAVIYARTELPSSMPNLETLSIYSSTEMVNTPMVTSKFLHLKFLNISIGGLYDFLSLVSFFDASPSLENFILNVQSNCMERVSIFADPSALRMIPDHRHDKLKCVKIINFSSAKSLIELTCHIVESTMSLEHLILDTTQGLPGCLLNKHGKCFPMERDAVSEG